MRSLLTRRLGFLCGAAFLGYATVAGVGYMVSFYARDEWDSARSSAASCSRASAPPGFVLGRPLGAAVQRIGRVRAVIIGALFSAACVAPLGFSTTPWQLAALWTLAGAGSVLLWTGLNTLAARGGAREPRRRDERVRRLPLRRQRALAVRLPAALQRRRRRVRSWPARSWPA